MRAHALVRVAVIGLAAAPLSLASPPPAQAEKVQEWHYDYWWDYFGSLAKCNSRGRGAVGLGDEDQRITGVVKFRCHRHHEDHRWSMDLLFMFDYGDGSGGGGGGGGSGSWRVTR